MLEEVVTVRPTKRVSPEPAPVTLHPPLVPPQQLPDPRGVLPIPGRGPVYTGGRGRGGCPYPGGALFYPGGEGFCLYPGEGGAVCTWERPCPYPEGPVYTRETCSEARRDVLTASPPHSNGWFPTTAEARAPAPFQQEQNKALLWAPALPQENTGTEAASPVDPPQKRC